MVVNSLSFLLFFVVVFVVYYLPIIRKSSKLQNFWLFITSYFFYGYADWKMIPILLGATLVFYGLGWWLRKEMDRQQAKNASWLTTFGVMLGIGVLLYFKYLNFFADSFAQFLTIIGLNVSWTTLNIVLPVGVSFFVFKLISYIIEIHREHIEPSKDFIEFATYIAFFPTILSGPIDRSNKFIPQLRESRFFNYNLAVDGCRQILWGMFTKMCVADNLATVTDKVWREMSIHSGSVLFITALLYFIQIYADFDGYSNMAIGTGKLLGINITRNFNHPFLARNVAEYWRRWHMSLTSFITDYVFMPLNIAYRSIGKLGIVLAAIINLVIIGLWHGANWTYALFGLYHGLLFIPLIYSGSFGKNKKLKANKYGLPTISDCLKMLLTVCIVSFGLIIFRASSVQEAYEYIERLFSWSLFDAPIGFSSFGFVPLIRFFVFILLICEWVGRDWQYGLELSKSKFLSKYKGLRWLIYVVLFTVTLLYKGTEVQFIYFQF